MSILCQIGVATRNRDVAYGVKRKNAKDNYALSQDRTKKDPAEVSSLQILYTCVPVLSCGTARRWSVIPSSIYARSIPRLPLGR